MRRTLVSTRNLSLQREKSPLPCCQTRPLRRGEGRQLATCSTLLEATPTTRLSLLLSCCSFRLLPGCSCSALLCRLCSCSRCRCSWLL